MLNKIPKSESYKEEIFNNNYEVRGRKQNRSKLMMQQRDQIKFKSFLKRVEESPPKKTESQSFSPFTFKQNYKKSDESQQQSVILQTLNTVESHHSQFFTEDSKSEQIVMKKKQKMRNPEVNQKQWVSRLKEKQVSVKFPQINLVQSALKIEESSIEPNNLLVKKHSLNKKDKGQYKIRSFSCKKVEINRQYSLLQAISKKKIEAWTINNWNMHDML